MTEECDEDFTIRELLPDSFVTEYTDFESTVELLAESGLIASSPGADNSVPGGEFDEFVEARTHFDSWSEMRDAARDYRGEERL